MYYIKIWMNNAEYLSDSILVAPKTTIKVEIRFINSFEGWKQSYNSKYWYRKQLFI